MLNHIAPVEISNQQDQTDGAVDSDSGGGIDLEKLAEIILEKIRSEIVLENERTGRV